MTFQTDQENKNNRYKNSPEGLNPELCSIWLGVRDSNPRVTGPKPVALPLGQPPIITVAEPRYSSAKRHFLQLGVAMCGKGIVVTMRGVVQLVGHGKTNRKRRRLYPAAQYERLDGAHAAFTGRAAEYDARIVSGVWPPRQAGALVGAYPKF